MSIIGGLTWRLRLVTFVHVPFSPPPLLILAFQPILFHTAIVTEGHYMLFSIEEQSCLTLVCQMTCQRSHICCCAASWWHNVFVLLHVVQFALVHFVWLRQRLGLLSFKKTTVHINLLEYFCFLEIDVCVYPSLCWLCSLSDILARHDSNI